MSNYPGNNAAPPYPDANAQNPYGQPPQGGSPYPPQGGSPYPPQGGSPYPPQGGSPYLPQGGSPYPPQGGSPYPLSAPFSSASYPSEPNPNQTSYPQLSNLSHGIPPFQPYRPYPNTQQNALYPPTGAPGPYGNHPSPYSGAPAPYPPGPASSVGSDETNKGLLSGKGLLGQAMNQGSYKN